MATIGHVAAGLAAGRGLHRDAWSRREWLLALLLVGLSLAPDLDVIAFSFNIPYHHPWGHRGATHSLFFSGLMGLLTAGLARALGAKALRWGLAVTLVWASHGLLDTLTTGGLGSGLLWPLSNDRFFAPWRPIPVAPIGMGMFSGRGLFVLMTELLLFSPVLAWSLWPRRRNSRSVPARDRQGET